MNIKLKAVLYTVGICAAAAAPVLICFILGRLFTSHQLLVFAAIIVPMIFLYMLYSCVLSYLSGTGERTGKPLIL